MNEIGGKAGVGFYFDPTEPLRLIDPGKKVRDDQFSGEIWGGWNDTDRT
jgi:hypothetical protein